MAVKFGLSQMTNPTPKPVKLIFKIIVFLAALWAFLSTQITEFGPITIALINKWTLISMGLVRFIIQFFGLDYDVDSRN